MIDESTYEGFIVPKDRQLTFNNAVEDRLFRDFLEKYEGESLWLELTAQKQTRTARQNRFYWVYLEKIAQVSGHLPEELHNTFKHAFLQKQTVQGMNGKTFQEAPSTTQLSKKEFSDYIKKIEIKTGVSAPSRKRYGL